MLTSPEEAYTDYLDHVVTGNGIDPVVVRSTLRQLGYDDATISIMMGEAEAPLSSFSSLASSATVSSKAPASSRHSVEAYQVTSHASHASSSLSASVVQPEFSRLTVKNESPATAHSDPNLPSLLPEQRSTRGSCVPMETASSQTTSSRSVTTETSPGSGAGSAARESITTPSSVSLSPQRIGESTHHDGPVRTLRADEQEARDIGSLPGSHFLRSAFTANERDVLRRWIYEYKTLLLSSAVPRRAADGKFSATQGRPTPEEPFDEHHRAPSTGANSICTEDAEVQDDVGDPLNHTRKTYAPPSTCVNGCREFSSTSSDGCSGDVTSSLSSSASSSAPAPTPHCRPERSAETVTRPPGYHTAERADARRHAACRPAAVPSTPFRNAVPKAASTNFVPALAPHRLGSCAAAAASRCTAAGGACRHPYREAQDVRVVRAPHALATRSGRAHSARGVSQARAREVDAAQQMQRTSRAEPTTGHRIPVMQPPVQPSVCPRSGLVSHGGTPSTLAPSARTDRVSLAQYYRREWQRQERRTTVASRDAVWDTRYALLSCSSA